MSMSMFLNFFLKVLVGLTVGIARLFCWFFYFFSAFPSFKHFFHFFFKGAGRSHWYQCQCFLTSLQRCWSGSLMAALISSSSPLENCKLSCTAEDQVKNPIKFDSKSFADVWRESHIGVQSYRIKVGLYCSCRCRGGGKVPKPCQRSHGTWACCYYYHNR